MDSRDLDTAATYALDALPPLEAGSFERHMRGDLADEVASFRRVAVALNEGLPDIVPAASPELWNHIAERAGIASAALPSRGDATRRVPWFLLAAAAVLVVLVVGATTLLAARDTVGDLRSQAVAAMAAPGALTATLESPDGVADVRPEVVIATDGTGYIMAESLPRLRTDRTYQLWVIVDDRVISAALLGNEPDVVQFHAEGEIQGIAISNEIAGGVVVSEVSPTAIWLDDTI